MRLCAAERRTLPPVGFAVMTAGRRSRYACIFVGISRANLLKASPSALWNGMPVSDSTRRRLRYSAHNSDSENPSSVSA